MCQVRLSLLPGGRQCALGTEALSCFRGLPDTESPVEWSRQVLCLSGLHTSAALGRVTQPPNCLLEARWSFSMQPFFSLGLLSNGHVNLSATLYRFWNYFLHPSPSVQSRLFVKKKERKEGSTCWAPLPRLRPEDKTPKNVNRCF